jgi:hypothetical protein
LSCSYRTALDLKPSSPDALLNLFSSNQQVHNFYQTFRITNSNPRFPRAILINLQLLDWADTDSMIQEIFDFTQAQLQQKQLTTVSPCVLPALVCARALQASQRRHHQQHRTHPVTVMLCLGTLRCWPYIRRT